MTTVPYIALEGLIGVGKSTLGKKWADNAKVHFLAERVNPLLLHCFYQDPKGYAFAFQMAMLKTRTWEYQSIRVETKGQFSTYLMDRSAIGDAVFSIANALTGSIKPIELDAYMYDLGTTTELFAQRGISALDATWLPERIIYLYDTVQHCQERVAVRANESESNIPSEYMTLLDILHFNLLLLPKEKLPFVVNTFTWDQYCHLVPDVSDRSRFAQPAISIVPECPESADIVLDAQLMDDMFGNLDMPIGIKRPWTEISTVIVRPSAAQQQAMPSIVTVQSLLPIYWLSDSVRWVISQLMSKLRPDSVVHIVVTK